MGDNTVDTDTNIYNPDKIYMYTCLSCGVIISQSEWGSWMGSSLDNKMKNEVYLNPSGEDGKLHDKDLFLEYRCFKNRNIHLRLNQEFMKAFNIEVARLKGWIHNKEDIVNEFDAELEIAKEDCDKYYKTVYQIETLPSQFLIDVN